MAYTPRLFNYFERVGVASADFADCRVKWNFISAGMLLLNEGTGIVEYSFDGTTVHGDLDSAKASVGIAKDNFHTDKVYFRLKTGTSIEVRVETWA